MKAPRLLFSKRLSKCCTKEAIVVQSRPGGFISQNCLKCGKSDYINEQSLPDLDCDFCGQALEVEKVDKNYFYICKQCGRKWKLGDNVPHYTALFEYSGLAVESDFPIS